MDKQKILDLVSNQSKEILNKIFNKFNPSFFLYYLFVKFLRLFSPVVFLIDFLINLLKYYIFEFKRDNLKFIFGNEKSFFNPNKDKNKVLIFLIYGNTINERPWKYSVINFLKNGYKVIAIVNGKNKFDFKDLKLENSDFIVYERKNYGYDMGAYKSIFNYLVKKERLNFFSEVCLLNDSVFFPATNPAPFFTWLDRPKMFGGGLVNYSKDNDPHLQSFFMQFQSTAIELLKNFFNEYIPLSSRNHAIKKGEVAISALMRKNNISWEAFINLDKIMAITSSPQFSSYRAILLNTNPTHTVPLFIIDNDFPFIKYDIFSKKINMEEALKFFEKKRHSQYEGFHHFCRYIHHILESPHQSLYSKFLQIYGLK